MNCHGSGFANPNGIELPRKGLSRSHTGVGRIRFDKKPLLIRDSNLSGLQDLIGLTQGRHSRNRANPGLNDSIPLGLEEQKTFPITEVKNHAS